MKNFKVIFPIGYQIDDIYNDNEDVNIVFETGDVYSACLVTPRNLEILMASNKMSHWWLVDLFVIRDMRKATIRKAIKETIERGTIDKIFHNIGSIQDNFGTITYDRLPDMNDTPFTN